MPVTTTEFIVKLKREKLWSVLNDLNTIGKCVPGCEEVQVLSPEYSRWKVKVTLGIVTRRIDARVYIIERSEPHAISIKIESVDANIVGRWRLDLSDQGEEGTRVTLTADLVARGGFEWVINQIMKTQLNKLVMRFADCISGKTTSTS